MKSKIFSSAVVVIGLTLMSASAVAQFTGANAGGRGFQGPGGSSDATVTVAQILRHPVDEKRVTLQGNVLRRIAGDKYVFSDGTGEIRVDIDDNEWPPQPVNEKTKVEISGKVDVDFMSPTEIDVKSLRIVN